MRPSTLLVFILYSITDLAYAQRRTGRRTPRPSASASNTVSTTPSSSPTPSISTSPSPSVVVLKTTSCPEDGSFTGNSAYIGNGPKAAPLLGIIGCIDNPPEKFLAGESQIVTRIFGAFEAGFTNDLLKKFFDCQSDTFAVPAGLDTLLTDEVIDVGCMLTEGTASILGDCGMHNNPAHAHEDMSCLYSSDPITKHSTRVGVALDGNGIYGKYIDGGVEPTDLDACGGRFGVTPDSNGETVYYYVITDKPPFTLGCFGPVSSLEECRAMYETCGDGETELVMQSGKVKYDLYCPCYDSEGNNSAIAV